MSDWANQQLQEHEDRQAEKIAEAIDRDARARHNEVHGPQPFDQTAKTVLIWAAIIVIVAILMICQGMSLSNAPALR
ncbi:hypothetical protein CCAX7_14480 [Capsulimonas corticalis]|uniref:Uncharacterized protein n=1 Tax=Capsulimonas corticalis TaxID=2219043 RepID=A0A402CZJ3_9BACT|nr:hypothetical protein [Capsulimonas corticalis]BDI29397.1 hypothetical protein CCAX7_14480 [Capsulimonas corticalis]